MSFLHVYRVSWSFLSPDPLFLWEEPDSPKQLWDLTGLDPGLGTVKPQGRTGWLLCVSLSRDPCTPGWDPNSAPSSHDHWTVVTTSGPISSPAEGDSPNLATRRSVKNQVQGPRARPVWPLRSFQDRVQRPEPWPSSQQPGLPPRLVEQVLSPGWAPHDGDIKAFPRKAERPPCLPAGVSGHRYTSGRETGPEEGLYEEVRGNLVR